MEETISKREEYAVVLDFLAHGKPFSGSRTPVAQVIGEKFFTLLEVVPKPGVELKSMDKVYIGQDKREQVHHIKGRINFSDLTNTSQKAAVDVLDSLISSRDDMIVSFFNKSGPITTRLHSLELLPGVGRKHMWQILQEREKQEFKDVEDITKRISLLPDPRKTVVKRILLELDNKDKYKLFVS